MKYILLSITGKKINNLKKILFFFLLSTTSTLFSQNGTIKGKVWDSQSKESLIGVSIIIKGTSYGATSDLDGNFTISKLLPGSYSLNISYIGYKAHVEESIIIGNNNKEAFIEVFLNPEDLRLEEVQIVSKANRESENVLLLEQQKTLFATQAVGAKEMSRKGISNAQSAVAQVSGVSKQEGVKNVFVRGLGDRYNATLLNGFPVPSEDPEYKNIALKFFNSDVIQNINVSKVFNTTNNGDIGGAVIDIKSKELFNEKELNLDLGGSINSEVLGINFLKQDGTNYLGFSNTQQPVEGQFNFKNSLDPIQVQPLSHNYGISGGKKFRLENPLNSFSFFAVASHSSDYSYTKETVRNSNSNGTIYQDQTGNKYSINTNQLLLANANLTLNNVCEIDYNFMLLHANDQYTGEFQGLHSEKHQDSDSYMGFLRRQQSNDNLLITNQFITRWSLSDRLDLNVGGAYNIIKGLEPDRRENYLSQKSDGKYNLTGSNRQKRFYSELNENDFNVKTFFRYKISEKLEVAKSNITIGYDGRFVNDKFETVEYNFGAYPGYFEIEDLKLDLFYNNENYQAGKFTMLKGEANKYRVSKYIHSGYLEGTHQLSTSLTANAGLRVDYVDMTVNHHVQHVSPGKESIEKLYYLPSLNIKYDINNKNNLRLGASRSYTLPQSKEISPYQYVNIGFASQGNPDIKPSDNYNVDLKWDYYLSPSELISLCGFYKHIINPIGRVDQGNSAGLLTYNNISPYATVAGIELEMRKNIINNVNTSTSQINKLSFGLNASYIYSNLELDITNTPKRNTQLEGASPFIINSDLSYNLTSNEKTMIISFVLNYFSDRIHTLGSRNYNDIVEKGIMTLDIVSSFKVNKYITVKLKAANISNPSYQLTRKIDTNNERITLNEYKKGVDISLGLSINL